MLQRIKSTDTNNFCHFGIYLSITVNYHFIFSSNLPSNVVGILSYLDFNSLTLIFPNEFHFNINWNYPTTRHTSISIRGEAECGIIDSQATWDQHTFKMLMWLPIYIHFFVCCVVWYCFSATRSLMRLSIKEIIFPSHHICNAEMKFFFLSLARYSSSLSGNNNCLFYSPLTAVWKWLRSFLPLLFYSLSWEAFFFWKVNAFIQFIFCTRDSLKFKIIVNCLIQAFLILRVKILFAWYENLLNFFLGKVVIVLQTQP